MAHDQCMYPLFRARFLAGTKPYLEGNAADSREAPGTSAQLNTVAAQSKANGALAQGPTRLGRLDLRALAREDAQPTEVGARRQKMAAFEKKCSEVVERVHVSGEWVAKDLATIQANRITHIINCVAALYPPFHEHMCTYKNLYLQGAAMRLSACSAC
jgi:hypothetical protein